MLRLPSTTEVHVRLPKEAFYRNMRISASTKRDFVEGVESITVVNSIKPSTANVRDGGRVHEIMVVAVESRGDEAPKSVIETIFDANKAKMLIVEAPSGRIVLRHRGKAIHAGPVEQLLICGADLDAVWDSLLAQVVLGSTDGENVEALIERRERMEGLRTEIARLDSASRRERQVARKNELFALMREKQADLKGLEEE